MLRLRPSSCVCGLVFVIVSVIAFVCLCVFSALCSRGFLFVMCVYVCLCFVCSGCVFDFPYLCVVFLSFCIRICLHLCGVFVVYLCFFECSRPSAPLLVSS